MWKVSRLVNLVLMLAGSLSIMPCALVAEPAITSSVQPSSLPKKKQTRLGLYVTAKEAAGLLHSNKEFALIDVRTPEETMFVGYPQNAAANVPFMFIDPSHGFNAKAGSYKLVLNPKFVDGVRAFLKRKNAPTLLLMCRSGSRSAAAVNALAEAGFTDVYSVVDGFEGVTDKTGKGALSGWKNSGAPWTTKVRENYWVRNH